jgi:hypothetical protein
MAALMASLATSCQGRGNLKPAPRLGLRGRCHCCHLFYKSSKKIKIQKSFVKYVATVATTPLHPRQGVMRTILIIALGRRHPSNEAT